MRRRDTFCEKPTVSLLAQRCSLVRGREEEINEWRRRETDLEHEGSWTNADEDITSMD